MTKLRPLLTASGLAALLVLAWAGPSSAHVEPDYSTVPAGEKATIAFGVEHGCEGEATTEVEIKVPDAVTDAQPVEKEGWTGSVEGQVVTFADGSQPGDEETTFSITFTAPDTEGEELSFPVVQHCGDAQIDWVQASEDDERPAPVVAVGPAGSPPSTEAAHDDGEGETADGHSSTTTDEHGSGTETTPEKADEGSDSSAPELIAAGVVVVVLVIGVALALTRGRRKEA